MNKMNYTVEELLPILLEVIESGGEFRFYPRGTSMLPLLRQERDSVVLVRPDTLSCGDICLYRRTNGKFVLHRLMKIEKDGTLTFCGDNQTALERGLSREAVIARVSAIYRDDKRIEMNALSSRLYRLSHIKQPFRTLRFLPRRIKLALRPKS